ncbi:MAG: hypothetical protein GY769_18020 [bacterium]|nr:hypothetical protein [bacterium]
MRNRGRNAGMVRLGRLLVLCALAFGACGPDGVSAADDLGSGAWRHDRIWDDGQAEFCAYEVDWHRYGRANPGRALLIAVKEPWAPDLEVKADSPRPAGFEVIKLTLEIELSGSSGWMRYSFAAEAPHALIHYEDSGARPTGWPGASGSRTGK